MERVRGKAQTAIDAANRDFQANKQVCSSALFITNKGMVHLLPVQVRCNVPHYPGACPVSWTP
jgi:hypothetical protein